MVARADRDDLVAEHDHAGHPQPHLDRPAVNRRAPRPRRGHQQPQRAARAQAITGQLGVDDHLIRAARAEHAARHHREPVDRGAEPAIRADLHTGRGNPGTIGKDQRQLPDLAPQDPRLTAHPGQAGQRPVIGLPGAVRDHRHISGAAGLQQPRERRPRALRPRGRGQHHPARQAHHQRQRQPRPPPGPPLRPQHRPGHPQHRSAGGRLRPLTAATRTWPAHQGHEPIQPRPDQAINDAGTPAPRVLAHPRQPASRPVQSASHRHRRQQPGRLASTPTVNPHSSARPA